MDKSKNTFCPWFQKSPVVPPQVIVGSVDYLILIGGASIVNENYYERFLNLADYSHRCQIRRISWYNKSIVFFQEYWKYYTCLSYYKKKR